MQELNLSSILLVDDDEISNLFNKIFIRKLNLDVEVVVASNGVEALDFLNSASKNVISDALQLPCLLLLDIKMPKMSGWEFLDAYEQSVHKHIRDEVVIVMLTTSEDEGDAIGAMNNQNVKEFLQKPLSEEKFTLLINTYYVKTNVEK